MTGRGIGGDFWDNRDVPHLKLSHDYMEYSWSCTLRFSRFKCTATVDIKFGYMGKKKTHTFIVVFSGC